MQADVESIIAALKAGSLDDATQNAAVDAFAAAAARDDAMGRSTGRSATPHLDKFITITKQRTVVRSSYKTAWQDHMELVLDALLSELTPERRARLDALLKRSSEKGAAVSGAQPENIWATLGKEEAIGLWGTLKGMGTGIGGMADTATWALVRQMQAAGIKVDDPPSAAAWLSKQYDISGQGMFGADYEKGDSAAIGEAGGTVIWTLVMLGRGNGAPGSAFSTVLAGLGIAGNLKGVEDAANAIAEAIARLQAQDKLTAAALMSDAGFIEGVTRLAASAFGAVSARVMGSDKASAVLIARLAKLQVALDAATVTPIVMKMLDVVGSKAKPDEKERQLLQLGGQLASTVISLISAAKDAKAASQRATAERGVAPHADAGASGLETDTSTKKFDNTLMPDDHQLVDVAKRQGKKSNGAAAAADEAKLELDTTPWTPTKDKEHEGRWAESQPDTGAMTKAQLDAASRKQGLKVDKQFAKDNEGKTVSPVDNADGSKFGASTYGELTEDAVAAAGAKAVDTSRGVGRHDEYDLPVGLPDAERGTQGRVAPARDPRQLTRDDLARGAAQAEPPADLSGVKRGRAGKESVDASGALGDMRRSSGRIKGKGAGGAVSDVVVTRDQQLGGIVSKHRTPGERDSQWDQEIRSKTPSPEVREWTQRSGRQGQPDEVIPEITVTVPSADHIVPVELIEQISGYGHLSMADQLKVLNNLENFIVIDVRVNSARGSTPYSQLDHVNVDGKRYDLSPAVQAQMKAREAQALAALREQVDQLYREQLSRGVAPTDTRSETTSTAARGLLRGSALDVSRVDPGPGDLNSSNNRTRQAVPLAR